MSRDMGGVSRRRLLKVSGGLLGGIAVGSEVVAAERTDRFVVETRGNAVPGGVEVVHEMPGVDFAVVEGSKRTLERSRAVREFAPDVELTLDEPIFDPRRIEADEATPADEP
ncbi:MAG: hypothetical protein V5A23_10125, partial [Halobacteriales archaeon]